MTGINSIKFFTVASLLLLLTEACAQNYDESKVPVYTLPDALQLLNGKKVADKSTWEKLRRPEVLKLFEDNVYGQMPKDYDSMTSVITNTNAHAMKGRSQLKEITVTIWKKNKSVNLHLTLFTPTSSKKPASVFLLINNRDKKNTDPSRDTLSEFWPAEMVIDSGYAIATFHVSDAAPDDKQAYKNGVLLLYPDQINADNGMKAIGAWAWAASRAIDFFEKDNTVDAKKVFIVGHSRGGKAALWAGAQDQRFAMVFANCSGNTGAALSRRKYGETITRINTSFPHWFCNNYKNYNDNETALPVDQHMLLALIAPRPLYTTNASKDLWADPKGSYLSAKNAEPVYALFKKPSALPSNPPFLNTPVISSYLGYHSREGIHDLTVYDWTRFIEFANYHLKKISSK